LTNKKIKHSYYEYIAAFLLFKK